MPGISVVAPSVLVTARSACGVSVSVSVALLLPATGIDDAAGLGDRGGVAERAGGGGGDGAGDGVGRGAAGEQVRRCALMLPLPLAGQLEPAEALHVQVTPLQNGREGVGDGGAGDVAGAAVADT